MIDGSLHQLRDVHEVVFSPKALPGPKIASEREDNGGGVVAGGRSPFWRQLGVGLACIAVTQIHHLLGDLVDCLRFAPRAFGTG